MIEARNLSAQNLYVTAASLNGEPLDRSWLRHGEIISGGRLVLTMGKNPQQLGEDKSAAVNSAFPVVAGGERTRVVRLFSARISVAFNG